MNFVNQIQPPSNIYFPPVPFLFNFASFSSMFYILTTSLLTLSSESLRLPHLSLSKAAPEEVVFAAPVTYLT